VITHENTGLTRAIVHEVMHDTTAVNNKSNANRWGTAKFECVHLWNITAIARARTVVFVFSNLLVFHGRGRGGVWDLTAHITCLVSP